MTIAFSTFYQQKKTKWISEPLTRAKVPQTYRSLFTGLKSLKKRVEKKLNKPAATAQKKEYYVFHIKPLKTKKNNTGAFEFDF